MRTAMRMLSVAVASAATLGLTSTAKADDVLGGVRVGYYTKVEEPFLGGELLVKLADRVYFNPNLEWVFVEDLRYFTVNGDFHYDFPTSGHTTVWVGAGLAVISVDPEGPENGDTDLGANFLVGIGFRRGPVIPYFQAKVIAKDDTEVSLGFGLRF